MAMNTEDSLREYLRLFVRIPLVGRIGPLARTFDFVADAAPGVKEILAVGKLCYEVRERHYDLVVVDAEASGHIVAQIGAPRAISELVQVGLVRDQTDWMLDILDDPARTGLVDRHHARGDAGHRDDRAGRPGRSRDRCRRRRRRRQPGAARRCSSEREADGVRARSLAAAAQRAAARGRRPQVGDRARRRRAGRGAPAYRRRAPRPPARRARRAMCRCCYVPELFTRAGGRARRSSRRVAEELLRRRSCELMAASAPRPPRQSAELLRAKEMIVVCGSGGIGKTTIAAALGARGRGDASAAGCWC